VTQSGSDLKPARTAGLGRWAVVGAALGGLAVLGLRLGIEFIDFGPNAPPDGSLPRHPLDLLAMLCPAPFLLWSFADADGFDPSSWTHLALAGLVNAALYALLAALIWWGLGRSKALLLVPALLVALFWYAILSM
jgi:hypothetical protein